MASRRGGKKKKGPTWVPQKPAPKPEPVVVEPVVEEPVVVEPVVAAASDWTKAAAEQLKKKS